MSEYIPTTESVRYNWAAYGVPQEHFDRWLNAERARVWDEGHGAPCDEWVVDEMCAEYHPNPYRK